MIADYMGPEDGPFRCGNCEYFTKQSTCTKPEVIKEHGAKVEAEGCCNYYEKGEEVVPISEYYKGSGDKVMSSMKKRYGDKKGKQVFYATANKKDLTGPSKKVKDKHGVK